jgi:hypothetical protein
MPIKKKKNIVEEEKVEVVEDNAESQAETVRIRKFLVL